LLVLQKKTFRAEAELLSKVKGDLAKDIQAELNILNKDYSSEEFTKVYKLKKNEVKLCKNIISNNY